MFYSIEMSFPFACHCFKWDCKIYFKSAWIYTKRHITKKKTNKKLEKALRMVCLKRKKRALKLNYPSCKYNLRNQDNTGSRPVRNRRQPDYLKDYHLGTLPLETPIRNTNLPPAHSNVCTLFRVCDWFCVVFQKNTKRTLTSPLQSPIVRKTPKVVRVVAPEDDPTTDDEENVNEVNIIMSATIR